jgi:hypothetical protein
MPVMRGKRHSVRLAPASTWGRPCGERGLVFVCSCWLNGRGQSTAELYLSGGTGLFARSATVVLLLASALVVGDVFKSSAFAQTPTAPSGNCTMWIDSATGQRVISTFPGALSVTDYRNQAGNIASSGHASSSITGQTFYSPDGGQTWIDSATGQSVVNTVPGALSVTDYQNQSGNINSGGHASSSITGQTFVLVPCPPPPPPPPVNSGFGFGGFGFGGGSFGGDDRGGQFDNGPRGRGFERGK